MPRALALALLFATTGCLEAGLTPCSSGLVCPQGLVCSVAGDECLSPDEFAKCGDVADGTECLTGLSVGYCSEGHCLPYCGNGIVEEWEQCDGEVPYLATCLKQGLDRGAVVCSPSCLLDYSGCADIGWSRIEPAAPPSETTDVLVFSATDLAAVGSRKFLVEWGTLSIFDGVGWTVALEVQDGVPPLHAVAGPSSSDLYLVGKNGFLGHWDGTALATLLPAPGEPHLYGIWSAPSGRLVVAGEGAILEYGDEGWQPLYESSEHIFYDVKGTDAGDLYAVGVNGVDGVVLRFTDAWREVHRTPGASLEAFDIADETRAIAVGAEGTIASRDENGWTTRVRGDALLSDVWFAGPDDVYIAGAGGTLLRDIGDGSWRPIDIPTLNSLTTVHGSGLDFLVAGSNGADGTFGRIFANENGTNHSTRRPPSGSLSLAMTGEHTGYIGGILDDLYGFDGEEFTYLGATGMLAPSLALHENDLYIVGSPSGQDSVGVFKRYREGEGVVDIELPTVMPRLTLIENLGGTLILGTSTTLHLYDKGGWTELSPPAGVLVHAVTGSSPSDFYIGGGVAEAGGIWHYDGSVWTLKLESDAPVSALWATEEFLFAGLADGRLMNFASEQWTLSRLKLAGRVLSLHGTGRSDVFVVAADENAGHFDGSTWSRLRLSNHGLVVHATPETVTILGGDALSVIERRIPW